MTAGDAVSLSASLAEVRRSGAWEVLERSSRDHLLSGGDSSALWDLLRAPGLDRRERAALRRALGAGEADARARGWAPPPSSPAPRVPTRRPTGPEAASAARGWLSGGVTGWAAAMRRGPRRWADGWDRDATCPADPRQDDTPGRAGWRSLGHFGGSRWQELHRSRRLVLRELRRAGYLARHRWRRAYAGKIQRGRAEVDSWRYVDGPAEGCEAVDPWTMAQRLADCSASWGLSLRLAGTRLSTMALPRRCNATSVCPVCAGIRSQALARSARSVIAAGVADGSMRHLALVTLTQRAHPDETMAAAVDRVRAAWRLMWRGGRGRRTREHTEGFLYGVEVTHKTGRGWHAHIHVVMALGSEDPHEARERIGREWRACTDEASAHLARDGERYGWDPHAGGCELGPGCERADLPADLDALSRRALRRVVRDGPFRVPGYGKLQAPELVQAIRAAAEEHDARQWRVVRSWAGAWWDPMPLDDLGRVYQACKYPTPIASLKGPQLAEFIAAAYGRRWHDGSGALRHVRQMAAELEEEAGAEEQPEGMPTGINVGSMAPGESPDLDKVAPGLGWSAEDYAEVDPSEEDCPERAEWRLPDSLHPHVALATTAAVVAAGGEVVMRRATEAADDDPWELWAVLPREWVSMELRARQQAAQAARDARGADGPGGQP